MAINFTYDEATNKVVVTGGTSGTPATFTNFVTFDRAGVDTILLSAGSPASDLALTYAVRPVEDLAILVKCVVANKTAEADFIFITGKDWRGAAQTESIDVTAGNGSYTTTKYWSEITSLDCSDNAAGGGVVWADGDLSVTQDVWGVIWDYGNRQYRIDAKFPIGDTTTPTYFKSIDESVYFSFETYVTDNADLKIGEKRVNYPQKGSYWDLPSVIGWDAYILASSGSALGIYGSVLKFRVAGWVQIYNPEIYDSVIMGDTVIKNPIFQGNNIRIYNTYFTNFQNSISIWASPVAFDNCHIDGIGIAINGKNTATVKGVDITDLLGGRWHSDVGSNGPNTLNFLDPKFILSVIRHSNVGNITTHQLTCNIHIADKDGADLAGVTVDCEDQFGVAVWAAGTIATNAGGDIAEQIITYKKWEGLGDPPSVTEYSPHKFTISKAGYETMVLDAVTVDGKIGWHLELLDELAEGDVRDGVAYGEDSEGNLELPAAGDVEDGVGFGSNGVEFTGDFEVPPEADVRDGEGYGAGGAEFEGDLDLPAIGDVEKGVQFDSLTKTGTFKSPAEPDVRDGEGYGEDDTEFTGTLDLPAEADVEDGVTFDGATKEGNFEAPAEADVEDGVGYGSNGAEFEGDLELPAEEDVEVGVGYGSLGTEFEGTYLGLRGNGKESKPYRGA